jgi:hypothetical protein
VPRSSRPSISDRMVMRSDKKSEEGSRGALNAPTVTSPTTVRNGASGSWRALRERLIRRRSTPRILADSENAKGPREAFMTVTRKAAKPPQRSVGCAATCARWPQPLMGNLKQRRNARID